MATFSVNNVHHGSLTAGVVDTINFPATGTPHEFLITNTGASDIYVRFDGVNPTVGGDDSYIAPANDKLDYYLSSQPTEITQVRIIGNNNGNYHCQRI